VSCGKLAREIRAGIDAKEGNEFGTSLVALEQDKVAGVVK
jgi:hypothetical protein